MKSNNEEQYWIVSKNNNCFDYYEEQHWRVTLKNNIEEQQLNNDEKYHWRTIMNSNIKEQ